jgi:tetratricopeptide (TPR) repeat protein
LSQARANAKTDIERGRLTMVEAFAYSAQERWSDMLPLAEELTKSFPNSLRAFNLAVLAYTRLNRLDAWEKLVQSRIQEHPDEFGYVRSASQLAVYRGQFEKSLAITKTLIDRGQATDADLNFYSWYALFLPNPVTQETIDIAVRANDLSKNSSFAVLHTLACVYAQAGKTSQARELLLKAMDSRNLEEPDSAVWLGFGLIAEQYGELDAAAKMYGRVEKAKFEFPGTSYFMAQVHAADLLKAPTASAKATGQ